MRFALISRFFTFFTLFMLGGAEMLAQSSPAYTSIVVFGDSLSDTGNDATVSAGIYGSSAQVPGPATGYTNGRFTDGTDTTPAARSYIGVWLEQMAAKFAAPPAVKNSLAGGTNYAYGFATTDVGTSVFTYGPGNALSFTVPNMGQQVTSYLATHPTITNKTLFIVWGGANDLIAATTSAQIVAAAQRDAGIVQQLITAGATDFIVPNLPPLGLVPRFNGSAATSAPATGAAQGFNQALAAYLSALPAANPTKTLHIYQLDTYTFFNTIVGAPTGYGFANVTASAQGNTTINPDTYLFWDDLHPTTYGHRQLATQALTLLGTPVTTTTVVTSNNLSANLGASVTLTATVTGTSGVPIGNVTFLDGSTTLGSSLVSGSTTSSTATYTSTALTAGTHTISAVFAGVNGYAGSTSSNVAEVVTAPALTEAFVPATLTTTRGVPVSANLTFTPVGGFSGTATIACGTLPAHLTCLIPQPSLTFSGSNAPQNATVAVYTNASAALHMPSIGEHGPQETYMALAFVPLAGVFGFGIVRRRRFRKLLLPAVLGVMAIFAMSGMTGCAKADPYANDAVSGTYTVPVMVTTKVGTTTTTSAVNLTVVVQ